MWNQTYLLFASHSAGWNLALSATLAAIPIFTLLLLLGVLRKPAWIAGLAGLAVTFVLSIGGYHMPARLALSAAASGAAFGLFPISWIVFWAIALFRLTVDSGQFAIIKDSVGRLTSDSRLQALLIAFAFGAFIEGAAGFGTPVAIAAAMLTGLGFSPFRAAAVCLLANTAPVAFGSIGIPVITLAGTTGLALDKVSGAVGRLCAPVSFFLPAYLILAMSGWSSLAGVWLPALVAGVAFALTQFAFSNYVGPQLTDIAASLTALAALVAVIRYAKLRDADSTDSHSAEESSATHFRPDPPAILAAGVGANPPHPTHTSRELLFAWLPYAWLVTCVLLWGVKPIQAWLDAASYVFPWPSLHDLVIRMPPIVNAPMPYHAIFRLNWFSASGSACMLATLLSAACLGMRPSHFLRLLLSVARQLLLPTLTVASVLAMAFLLNYSGATSTLGLAFASTGVLFPFFSALLGWLGVFLTGSDTSANALFGNLQIVTAGRLGLDPVLMAATNSVGGVMGKMISLQTIAVAAAATGMTVSDQSRLFRFTLKHSLFLVTAVGGLALLYAYVFHFTF